MIDFLFKHTSSLFPILFFGILAIGIVLERFKSLYLVYPLSTHAFFEKIQALANEDRLSEAVSLCDRYHRKPVAQVVKEGLMRAHQPQEIIEHGLVVAAGIAADRIKARTGYLSMIANVATLLGLIGTILGLIESFNAVGSANAQNRSAMLATGISIAMNHTLWGLSVAVPCMVVFSALMNKTNRLKAEVDRAVVRTLEILRQRDIISSDPDYSAPVSKIGGSRGPATRGQRRAV